MKDKVYNLVSEFIRTNNLNTQNDVNSLSSLSMKAFLESLINEVGYAGQVTTLELEKRLGIPINFTYITMLKLNILLASRGKLVQPLEATYESQTKIKVALLNELQQINNDKDYNTFITQIKDILKEKIDGTDIEIGEDQVPNVTGDETKDQILDAIYG